MLALDSAGHVDYRPVQLGSEQGNLRVIASGLQPGDKIVVDGLQRVRPGAQVQPHLVPMTGSNS